MDSEASRFLRYVNGNEPVAIASTLLVVLILIVLIKARFGRGSPLHGGMPSGHAAVSFVIATLLTLRTEDPTVGVLSGTLALMVSHSRLLHRIHTAAEVLAGAALGVLVGSILFWLLY
jgi:diacylglycerol kinase (ATP)